VNVVSGLSKKTSNDLFSPDPPRRKTGIDIQEMRETREIPKTQEALDQSVVTSAATSAETSLVTVTGETNWQSPEYEVVETALEVTAYALATR
jgi:coenzyme PQQ precursor peptide PqqA